ncbi:2-oxoglutarate (2OG) and Fe(II)-dependent oxygenase superfamily protein [Quillaja saponaria]|uniref:2-oxoglutarate (2OG) and Fe(II)-dependent oxygenase superfamily protein n=1 Tax=Quillaja saponaria TaxID=32244 RepID=A0AAD7M2P3_QUISA|nr:2-oxoglutarate (2OG) and Fe(II)-dependent oxygenase superfamily protein [Quillaja saponaria]
MATYKQAAGFDFDESTEHSVLSVQHLIAKEPLSSIPQQFVRPNQEPQSTFSNAETGSLPTVPTIDMKQLLSDEASADIELEKLHSACKEWGLFQLVNHGVSTSLLDKFKHEIEEFFQLPLEEKAKYRKTGDLEGYGCDQIITKDKKLDWGDRLYMTTNPLNSRKSHIIPELPYSFRNTLESYIVELQKLAVKVLDFLGRRLKMEKREMGELFEDGRQSVRITYYPPCPQPELVMGITPHTDGTGITILNQVNGVNGLELKKDGIWIPVNVLSNALIVNLGDIIEIMSNGMYKSVEHRAIVNTEKERISVAMFISPHLDAEIGPVTSLTSPQNPPIFKTIGMEKYVKNFFTYNHEGRSHLEYMRL